MDKKNVHSPHHKAILSCHIDGLNVIFVFRHPVSGHSPPNALLARWNLKSIPAPLCAVDQCGSGFVGGDWYLPPTPPWRQWSFDKLTSPGAHRGWHPFSDESSSATRPSSWSSLMADRAITRQRCSWKLRWKLFNSNLASKVFLICWLYLVVMFTVCVCSENQ